jgi:segregation and condensation protein A
MLEVRIEEAPRAAEPATLVRVADFDGPLGLLLSLIESRRLDVLTVPLGALAGAYLDALASLPAERLGNVSAFVAIASQLILIKSRAILPRAPILAATETDEGADPEAELRARLLVYRAHRDAARRLEAAAAGRRLFRREPSVAAAAARANARPAPAPPLPATLLERSLASLARIAPAPAAPPEVMRRTVTISQRVEVIRAALREADAIVLQELLEFVRDRVVRAVTFLAMLELVKRREISVEQDEPFGPILARRVVREGGQ